MAYGESNGDVIETVTSSMTSLGLKRWRLPTLYMYGYKYLINWETEAEFKRTSNRKRRMAARSHLTELPTKPMTLHVERSERSR